MKKIIWQIRSVGKLAAAAFLALCFFGVCYPELAFSGNVCERADGKALESEDYEKLFDVPEGGLQITFGFLKREESGKDQGSAGAPAGTEGCREEDNVGSTGIQGEARRGF